MSGRNNIYRDGKVHVLSRECETCIFRPKSRPVDGRRVAGMVRETKDEPGATVVCHSTLYGEGPEENAVCRGWYDRLADRDPILRLAKAVGAIGEQEPPEH
jgi:hypothetical protein